MINDTDLNGSNILPIEYHISSFSNTPQPPRSSLLRFLIITDIIREIMFSNISCIITYHSSVSAQSFSTSVRSHIHHIPVSDKIHMTPPLFFRCNDSNSFIITKIPLSLLEKTIKISHIFQFAPLTDLIIRRIQIINLCI